jgi:hypothetical protein
MLTTLAVVVFLLFAVRDAGENTLPALIVRFLVPLWAIVTGIMARKDFFLDSTSVPPILFLYGILPALLLIITYFIFFRASFIQRLSLQKLTLLHIARIPVEFTLLWLFMYGQVPQVMTFEGRNFDILSGILAPAVYLIAFRSPTPKRWLLIAYNVIGLVSLANIVTIAIMALPSPMQSIAFDQPNRAVRFFPYIWLPTIIVPIVLFCHLAALWKLAKTQTL